MPHSPLWVVLAVLCLFTLPPDISAVRPPDHFQTKSVSGHGVISFNTGSFGANFGLFATNGDQATAVIYVQIWGVYSSNYTLRGNVSRSGDVRHFSRANGNLYETVTNLTQNTEYTVVAEVLDNNNDSIVNFTANVKTVTTKYFFDNDLTSTPKEITTPGWPNNYPDNVFYCWNLTADPGFKIELTVHEGESETYDQLYAYEPHTRFYFMPLFWIIGNVTEPKIATSNSSNVLIYFASDASVNKKGFRITYIQTGGPDPEPTTAAPFVKPTPQVTGSGGNELIHIDLHSSYFNYTITFNAINTEVMNADSYIIEGLVNDQSYEIEVIVKDGGVIVETFTLEVKTSSFCTTSCTNSVCALENGVLPVCKCKPGYTENMNDSTACVDIHECGMPGIDCPVNSVCSNTVGSFVCRCVSGYTLVDGICEVINLCETSTLCMNGGSCSPLPNDYKCDCPQYYSGKSCQSYTSPCISGPCKNLGTCNDLSGSFNCSCTVAYKGSICETDADECQDGTDKCVANSMCSNTVGSHACTCNEGYTGDGFVKCNEIRLLDYGPDTDVLLTPIRDGVSSPALEIPIQLPFGRRSFDVMFVTSNGLITLGRESWWVRYLWRPYQEGFGVYRVPLIAPFWEDFHPHRRNEGRVYYQVYNKMDTTLGTAASALVDKVDQRIADYTGNNNFKSLYVLKATWHKVVMYWEYYNRDYPNTFQAVVATDGEDTFVLYNYMEDGMLWNTRKRWWGGNRALIGYTNAEELEYIETQGEYKPDHRPQTVNGTKNGQYVFQLTPDTSKTVISNARKSCLSWFIRDSLDPWQPEREPCPCTAIQARSDRRFSISIELYLHWIKIYSEYWWWSYWGYPDGSNFTTTEWNYDEAEFSRCYQMRVGTGPRCCYGSRERNFNRWWGWWLGGPIIEGPRGSRYERHQIPIVERSTSRWWWWSSIWYREQSVLDQQYQLAMDNDLKPRRHCCIESESNFYCGLYKQNRPTATCEGYVQRWPSWNWGDPHITTTDGNSYTFNGIGEYHYLYAPDVLSVQGRIKKATKEDGTEAGGTIFVSFAIRDFTFNTSGIVQFDVDPNHVNGTGILVRVNGVLQNNITETAMDVNQVSLSTSSGAVEAAFPSGSSASVSASDFMLSMEFTGDTNSLMNISKGLLGAWNGNKSDDFEFRNGTVLKLSDIEVTENSDILNGTLSEQKLYPFGLSWKIMEDESIFNYTGGNDTYALHNPTPTSDPPFLEVLVKEQAGQSHFESVKANCTTNGVVSTTCLYDVLVTNRTEIGQTTLSDAATSSAVASANANTPPNATISDGDHVENGNTFLAKLNASSTMTVSAIDPDGDSVTFHIFPNNSVAGITVDENSGVVSWTPTEANRIQGTTNQTLVIQAIDSNGGETLLTVNIKLCVCNNSGVCLYNETLLGVENYEIVRCSCNEAYSGDDCSEDRNGCLLSACYAGVNCTDNPAPETGETCGPCPEGTTGDGKNCTNIDLCESNPCQHLCETLYNDFQCSCNDGYRLNATDNTTCVDINECMEGTPCNVMPNSVCNNTIGNYSCYCPAGFTEGNNRCDDIDECTTNAFTCPSTATDCFNKLGTYGCSCNAGYSRAAEVDEQSECTDTDECALNQHTCNVVTEVCRNVEPSFACDCRPGFHLMNGVCDDIRECQNSQLNNCSSPHMQCIEQEPGFSCACLPGYQLNGQVCEDINECLTSDICPVNTNCVNRDGGYTCRCDPNYVCPVNPFVNPVTVLSKSQSCVTVLIDDGSLYGLYEVKAVSNQNNFLVNSSAIKTKICGLSPNTQYNISVRVLALKGSNQLFTTTEFSAITAAKTDALKIRLSLRVLSETFVTEMSNIASASAVAFRGRHESTLNNGLVFTNGGNTLTSSVLVFIRLSAGSVRADSEALLTSQNMADSSATAAGTNLDSAVYADVMTITDFPDPPANLVISEVTDSTITVRYDEVTSAIHYEIQLTCTTTSVNLVTTSTTHTIPDLPSNTICSVQVRVLVALGAAAARSDYSDSIETTTVPAVLGLQATSITETSAVISFNSVTRGVYYTVQSAAGSNNLTQSQVVSGNLSLSVGGLVKSTTYTYTVVAVALDVDGNLHSSAPATLTFTTSGLCGVNPCFNGGLCSEDGTLVGCLCPSGYTGILCEAKDNSEALKIGLGVTGGVIGGALIVLVLVWYVKKRPQAYSLHPDEKPSNFEE